MLACGHFVKWEYAEYFCKWAEKITQEMVTIEPSSEDDPCINHYYHIKQPARYRTPAVRKWRESGCWATHSRNSWSASVE